MGDNYRPLVGRGSVFPLRVHRFRRGERQVKWFLDLFRRRHGLKPEDPILVAVRGWTDVKVRQ
jgi:hypothetical protein